MSGQFHGQVKFLSGEEQFNRFVNVTTNCKYLNSYLSLKNYLEAQLYSNSLIPSCPGLGQVSAHDKD